MAGVGMEFFALGLGVGLLALYELARFRGPGPRARRPESAVILWTVVAVLLADLALRWRTSTAGQELLVAYLFERLLLFGNLLVVARLAGAAGLTGEREQRFVLWSVLALWLLRVPMLGAGEVLAASGLLGPALLGGVGLGAAVALVAVRSWRPPPTNAEAWLIPGMLLAHLGFAAASLPAVHAVTHDGVVAWASHVLSLIGVVPLYLLASRHLARGPFYSLGLGTVLMLLGGTLLLQAEIPTSLPFVATTGLAVWGLFLGAGTAGRHALAGETPWSGVATLDMPRLVLRRPRATGPLLGATDPVPIAVREAEVAPPSLGDPEPRS